MHVTWPTTPSLPPPQAVDISKAGFGINPRRSTLPPATVLRLRVVMCSMVIGTKGSRYRYQFLTYKRIALN